MKKRILGITLAICMMIFCVPMGVFAESAADVWDGTADTSWYTSAPDASEYHISMAEQLAGLAQLVNAGDTTFSGKTIYLDSDLDLGGYEWVSIATGSNQGRYFAGTFDGQYHEITNLFSRNDGSSDFRSGLFGVVSDGGVLKNLYVTNADIVANDNSLLAGILADWVNGGTVQNCYTSGTIVNAVGDKFVGGLVGQCTWVTQILGCASDANVISKLTDDPDAGSDVAGGLIGQWEKSGTGSLIADWRICFLRVHGCCGWRHSWCKF